MDIHSKFELGASIRKKTGVGLSKSNDRTLQITHACEIDADTANTVAISIVQSNARTKVAELKTCALLEKGGLENEEITGIIHENRIDCIEIVHPSLYLNAKALTEVIASSGMLLQPGGVIQVIDYPTTETQSVVEQVAGVLQQEMKSAIQLKAQLLRVITTVEFARAISSFGPIDQQGAVNEEIFSNSGKILLIAEEVEFKSSQILKHRNVEAYGRLVAINSLSLVVQSISRRTAVAETAYLQNIKERKRKQDRKKKR